MKDKIIEIGKELYEELNALYHTPDGTTNKYNTTMDKSGVFKFIELLATRIMELFPQVTDGEGIGERELGHIASVWLDGVRDFKNMGLLGAFKYGFRKALEWMRDKAPTREIDEGEIRQEINKYLFPASEYEQDALLEWDQAASRCAKAIKELTKKE